MEKKKYYTVDADMKQERKSIMDADGDVPQIMSEMTNDNGVIPVRIDPVVAIQTVSRNMYTDPIAGIREYVNNEARPCREAVSKGYEDVSIYITVDAGTRNITIEGRNSMGMSLEMFKEVYTVLGRSGNFDGEESGQFGFGRAAYLCLSDLMVFETWSRETNEKFGFVGKNVVAFEPIPSKKLSIKQYGTKITMNMRKDVDLQRMVKYINKVSMFLRVDVFLEIVGNINDVSGNVVVSDINSNIQQIGPVSLIDAIGGEADVHIDNDDYELVGISNDSRVDRSGWQYNLIGIPINVQNTYLHVYNDLLPHCIINIKNERKYMPTSSRDTLTAESITLLHSKIKSDLAKCFRKINITCMQDYYDNKNVIFRLCCIYPNYSELGFGKSVVEFCELMSIKFNCVITSTRHDGYQKTISAFNKGYSEAYYFSVIVNHYSCGGLWYMNTLSEHKMNAFTKLNPGAGIITPVGTGLDRLTAIARLKQYGIKNVDEYLKTVSVDVEIVNVMGGKPGSRLTDILVSDLSMTRTVKLSTSPDKWLFNTRHALLSKMKFVKNSESLEGIGYTLEEFCDGVNDIMYNTSEGMLTGREILNKYSDGLILLWDDIACEKCLKYNCTRNHRHENRISISKCKNYSEADIVIKHVRGYDKKMKICRLVLAYAFTRINKMRCYNRQNGKLKMFDLLRCNSECIVDGIMRDNMCIDVDGVWKNVCGMVHDMSLIRNIPVRILYAKAINVAGDEDERCLEDYADNVIETILEIDRRSDEKTLMDICTDLVKEYRYGIYDPHKNIVYDVAFEYLIRYCCKEESDMRENNTCHETDKATRILRLVFGDIESPHYISDDIKCTHVSSSISVTFHSANKSVTLRADCMLFEMIRRIFPKRGFYKIAMLTISDGDVTITL